jgi:hypothetical protein
MHVDSFIIYNHLILSHMHTLNLYDSLHLSVPSLVVHTGM